MLSIDKKYMESYGKSENTYCLGVSQKIRELQNLRSLKVIGIDRLSKCYLAGIEREILGLCGGKALGFVKLRANGIKIPRTNVISVFEESFVDMEFNFESELYAVRSSANMVLVKT